MTDRRVLAGFLLATTFLNTPQALAQEKSEVLAPIEVQGEAVGDDTSGFDGYKAKKDASATKSDQPLEKTPQAVSVVGGRQIEDQAARSVVEATRYAPGIRSETFGNDTRNDWFLIRGFSSQVNSYFLDGLQLQSSDSFATWKVNPYLLDRIDILRGPSSALYGASNPGGLINLVSKRPTFQNRGETAIGVNEFGNVWSGLDVEGVNKDGTLAYRFIATGNYGGTQVDYTDNDQFAIMPEVTWKPDEDTSLTVYANVSKLKTRGQNFLPYVGTVVDAPWGKISRDLFTSEPSVDKFERSQQMIGYEFEHRFDNDVTVRQNLRYGHLDVDFRNVYGEGWLNNDPASGMLDRANFLSKPDLGLFTVDNQVEWKTSTGPIDHTLLVGLDYKRFDLHDESGFEDASSLNVLNPVYGDVSPVTSRYDQSNTLQNQTGLYAQDTMQIDRWNFVFSGRYDDARTHVTDRPTGAKTSYSSDAFSGRAGVIYNFDNGISPYASISRSFLPLTGTDAKTGEAFKPETAVQYEAGVKYQPTWLSDVMFSASLFDLTRQNVVTGDGQINFNRQIGKVNSRGIELEAVGQLTPDLKLTGAYTWYDLKIKQGNPAEIGKVTTGTPEQFGSLWLDYAIPSDRLPGVTIGGGVRYVGSSYADAANTQKVPDYAVVDAAIRYEKDNFKAALNVSNLFDKTYVASCNTTCFYGESREISLTMGYKW